MTLGGGRGGGRVCGPPVGAGGSTRDLHKGEGGS